ncbi:MAG: hypothetical protein PHF64_06255 [Methanoregula sp.]|nr:hypothetical protein [Methanoregula sp.]
MDHDLPSDVVDTTRTASARAHDVDHGTETVVPEHVHRRRVGIFERHQNATRNRFFHGHLVELKLVMPRRIGSDSQDFSCLV